MTLAQIRRRAEIYARRVTVGSILEDLGEDALRLVYDESDKAGPAYCRVRDYIEDKIFRSFELANQDTGGILPTVIEVVEDRLEPLLQGVQS